jgi:hypothetical protein
MENDPMGAFGLVIDGDADGQEDLIGKGDVHVEALGEVQWKLVMLRRRW